MNNILRYSFVVIGCFTFLLCLENCAYAVGLPDIEAAILERHYPQAEKFAKEFIPSATNKPAQQKAQYYLGLSQLRQGHYAKARESFQNIGHNGLDPVLKEKVSLGIFDTYYYEEDYVQALATLKEFLKHTSKPQATSLIYLKLARVNLKLAYWSEAQEYLEKIVRSFPNSFEVPAARQLLEEKHYFAVQVGAFTDRDRAETLVDELRLKGEYAYIIETQDPKNRKFFRVRVGQLAFLREAKRLEHRLTDLGYPTKIYP